MDRFLHIKSSNKYPKTKKLLREEMNPKKKEPKNNNNKELIPLNFSPI